jgi:hypothetical protein
MARPTYPSLRKIRFAEGKTFKQQIEQTLQTVSYVDAKAAE